MNDQPRPDSELRRAKTELTSTLRSTNINISRSPGMGTALLLHASKLAKVPGKVNVLHVEDDLTLVQLLEVGSEALTLVRFVPVRTFGGARAELSKVPHAFDVVLLDLNLPDSEGVETLDRIRAVDPVTPVIVYTGTNADPKQLKARGASCTLLKSEADFSAVFLALAHGLFNVTAKREAK